MLISLRAIEMISKMKTKAPTLEIKTFCSLRRAVILKMQKRDKEQKWSRGDQKLRP